MTDIDSIEYRRGFSDGKHDNGPALLGGDYWDGYVDGCRSIGKTPGVRVMGGPVQKPSPGRILQFNIPHIGWRPMIVTSVGGPTKWAVGDGENPVYVNGWAKLCPTDCEKDDLMRKLSDEIQGEVIDKNEYPVVQAYEGEAEGNWRWPPRV